LIGKEKYIPAYYSNILDAMLTRGAKAGQGGHLEGNSDEVSRSFGWLDSCPFLFSEVANMFGMDESESIITNAISHMGQYRGNDIRRFLESKNLPLTAENLDNIGILLLKKLSVRNIRSVSQIM